MKQSVSVVPPTPAVQVEPEYDWDYLKKNKGVYIPINKGDSYQRFITYEYSHELHTLQVVTNANIICPARDWSRHKFHKAKDKVVLEFSN